MGKKPVDKRQQKIGMLVFGGMCMFLAVFSLMVTIWQQNTYTRTQGVVVDFVAVSHINHYRGSIDPKIKFTINNKDYTKVAKNSLFTNPFLKVGDKVNILYSISEHRNEVVIDSFWKSFGIPIFSSVFGLLFISIGRSIKED